MKSIKRCRPYIIAALIIVAVLSVIACWLRKQAEYREERYELEEIESGTYARYYQAISTVPAHNYDVVEICVNGNLKTYKGYASITYADEAPCAVIMQNNLANDDKVFLRIPKGTVEYEESVGVR